MVDDVSGSDAGKPCVNGVCTYIPEERLRRIRPVQTSRVGLGVRNEHLRGDQIIVTCSRESSTRAGQERVSRGPPNTS